MLPEPPPGLTRRDGCEQSSLRQFQLSARDRVVILSYPTTVETAAGRGRATCASQLYEGIESSPAARPRCIGGGGGLAPGGSFRYGANPNLIHVQRAHALQEEGEGELPARDSVSDGRG